MLKWYKGSQVKDQVTTGPFLLQLCWGLVSLWHSWRLAQSARVCEQFAFAGTRFPCSELFQSDHSIINGLRCSKTLQNVWLLQISRVATNAWPRPSFESSLSCVANLTHCDHQGLCIFLCYIRGRPSSEPRPWCFSVPVRWRMGWSPVTRVENLWLSLHEVLVCFAAKCSINPQLLMKSSKPHAVKVYPESCSENLLHE